MRALPTRTLFVALTLLASGCMLPQPDTPLVPPNVMVDTPRATSPAAPAAPAQPAAGNGSGAAELVASSLSGQVRGAQATAVAAVNADTGATADSRPIAADGTFGLSLPPGRYWLDLTVDGAVKRVGQAISLGGGERRTITLTVAGDRVTITEEAPLIAASPSPTPSPSPDADNTVTGPIR
jgi:hypothetical protein